MIQAAKLLILKDQMVKLPMPVIQIPTIIKYGKPMNQLDVRSQAGR